MEFNVPKTHELFRQMIREFVEKEVKPIAAEVDENERFPMETVEKMAKIGIMGIPIPKQYGGAGGDNLMYAMAVEELSKACGTTGVIVSAHTSLGTWPILKFGNEKQKQKYLPKMASGEWIGAFGLTEPNAGTDAAGQQTMAVQDPETGEWILNGAKIFITNAGYAHVYVVFAMTDKSKGLKGISAFIVEANTPGFSIGKKEMKLGKKVLPVIDMITKDRKQVIIPLYMNKQERFILLVKEQLDGKWALPGGYQDVNVSIRENVIKEASEEAGAIVKPSKVIAVLDYNRHHHVNFPYGMVKIFVLCEYIDHYFKDNTETLDAKFFSLDNLPELSSNRTTIDQIKMCFDCYNNIEDWETIFD